MPEEIIIEELHDCPGTTWPLGARILFGKWLIALGLPLSILILSKSHSPMTIFFAVTLWALLAWCFEILPADVVGFILPVLYVTTAIGTPQQVFSPWAGTVPWMVLGALIIGEVMLQTGLAQRIADWALRTVGSSFNLMLAAIMLTGVILAPLIPSATGKLAILTAVGVGICRNANFAPKSKAATAVMLTIFFAVHCPAQSYLTGSARIPMAMDLVRSITNISVNWAQYAYHNWLLGLVYSAISLMVVICLLKPEQGTLAGQVAKECKKPAPLSLAEKKAVLILAGTLVLLMTESFHHINAAWILMLVAGLLFFPGINLMDRDRLQKVNFSVLFYMTGALSIGVVAEKVGAAALLAKLLLPMIQGSPFYTVFSVYIFGVLSTLVLHVFGSLAAFTAPLSSIAMHIKLNPYPVIYSFKYGIDQLIFPYEDSLLLYIYSFGYISMSNMLRVFIVKTLVIGAFISFIAYPYWHLIGLL